VEGGSPRDRITLKAETHPFPTGIGQLGFSGIEFYENMLLNSTKVCR
jgi:hypothetical protein